jgi:preprotein translocase subunit SecA
MLERRGVPHAVLNAKQHEREGVIVAQGGRLNSVTVATNMAGRGVDIILGGNAEGLAKMDLAAEGLDPETDEGAARYQELFARYDDECRNEGDKIRELGGLYVLGTERHESRRIDNQLRGRSGRQGDPGESRFYLSLEDELMRLFATGAMNWVMNKALPEDVPIDSRMVSRAIERAQGTVEARNAEIRKDVLKYDEVMNEQRKVIYARRQQILDGESLRDQAFESLDTAMQHAVETYCPTDFSEDWDLEGLMNDVLTYYPTRFTAQELSAAQRADEIYDSLLAEATSYYEQRETDIGEEAMREIERRVMLSIIDQRWREHLYEMDYLQEGINLRAMGQRDPLVEWQREGFEMFTMMMDAIAEDFVKYVMHLEVISDTEAPTVLNVQYSAPEDPVQGSSGMVQAAALQAAEMGEQAPPEFIEDEPVVTQVVKGEHEKVGRNDPCWCGSGKKYKRCHGAAA